MAIITFESVSKRFGNVTVIEKMDLTIKEGEFFTFVGGSGCGKSTILNMIAGLEDVSGGTIYFDGKRINHLPPASREVAMVFQSYALYPHLNVYENIAFPLRVKKTPEKVLDREVKRVAESLGLFDLLRRRPGEISGGQKQRTALGRAIIRKPRVFLMDEPLSNLDAGLRIETRLELKRLHRELGITTVYVTHDQEEAMSLSERIAVLKGGKIQQCDRPLEVYNRPANLAVAKFIGSPPMNLFDASLLNGTALDRQLSVSDLNNCLAGIRPFDLTATGEKSEEALEMEVILLEPTGRELWVEGTWKGTMIKARGNPGDNFAPGRKVYLKVLPEKIHLFSKAYGERVG